MLFLIPSSSLFSPPSLATSLFVAAHLAGGRPLDSGEPTSRLRQAPLPSPSHIWQDPRTTSASRGAAATDVLDSDARELRRPFLSDRRPTNLGRRAPGRRALGGWLGPLSGGRRGPLPGGRRGLSSPDLGKMRWSRRHDLPSTSSASPSTRPSLSHSSISVQAILVFAVLVRCQPRSRGRDPAIPGRHARRSLSRRVGAASPGGRAQRALSGGTACPRHRSWVSAAILCREEEEDALLYMTCAVCT